MSETKFKVGDKVKAWGMNGVVTELEKNYIHPIVVKFDSGRVASFYLDGRASDWHKTPTLKLRKFKKVDKPPKEVWLNVHKHGLASFVDKTDADRYSLSDRIGNRAWKYVRAKDQS